MKRKTPTDDKRIRKLLEYCRSANTSSAITRTSVMFRLRSSREIPSLQCAASLREDPGNPGKPPRWREVLPRDPLRVPLPYLYYQKEELKGHRPAPRRRL
jgi:hypothetical protein